MSPVIRASPKPGTSASSARPAAQSGTVQAKVQSSGKKGAVPIKGSPKLANKYVPPFARQIGAMLSAGMPIVASLETLEEQAPDPRFKATLGEVRRSIENGSAFSEALAQVPSFFDDLFVNMVRSGERSGQLAETMKRIAALLDADAKLRRKVKSAMTYPIIVLSLSLLIATGMIVFIVPVFKSMFEDFGAKLPALTQFLVDLSAAARSVKGLVFVIFIVIGLVIFKKWKKTEKGAFIMDGLYLRAPVFGVLTQKVAVARFARTLSQLVSSGVPILSALEIVAKATGNLVIGAAIMDARGNVERGDTLSSGLQGKACMPMLMVRMLAAGEKTGKVDEMLESIADTYDDEVETMLSTLTSMLEPLLMIFLGVIIGGIVIAMFLPIFKLGEVVSAG